MTRNKIDTDRIKQDHPVAEVVSCYGVKLKRRGRNLVGLCPFHEERKPSFSVDPERGLWYCFGCSEGGDVITFVQKMEGADFVEACGILTRGGLPELDRQVPDRWTQAPTGEPENTQLSDRQKAILDLGIRVYHTALLMSSKGPETAYGYLLRRGLAVETIQEFQVGCCSGKDLMPALRYVRLDPELAQNIGLLKKHHGRRWEFFTDRITFVERDRTGKVIHMAGRALGSRGPKYLFLPGVSKPVYGLSRVRWSKPVFVVEGIFDYITLRQWGYQGVATLGTSLKADIARRLARAPFTLFVPDNDEAGAGALARWRRRVGQGVALRLPDGVGDVNDLMDEDRPQEAFEDILTADVVVVTTALEDYVRVWRWGYQAVAAVDQLRKGDRQWLLRARRVVFVLNTRQAERRVRRWQREVTGSSVVSVPAGGSLESLGEAGFRKAVAGA
jgi:DNA primase